MPSSTLRLRHGCAWQLALSLIFFVSTTGAFLGFNYGRNGDNLPSPADTVRLLHSLGISHVRLYDTDPTSLTAFQSPPLIQLLVGIPNSDLPNLNTSSGAASWVATQILPFLNSTAIGTIAVGNEVLTGFPSASSALVPAMRNLYDALAAQNLQSIKISSPCSMELLSQSYVPSSGEFNASYDTDVAALLSFLSETAAPFMVNVYPWKAYSAQPDAISLDYALFNTTSNNAVLDPGTNLSYTNLFDAQVDAVYAALARANHSELVVDVGESGWPTEGDVGEVGASVANAQMYSGNLVKHVGIGGGGTPGRPGAEVNTFLYEIYNEDLNVGLGSQRNFGMFRNDSTPMYAVNFTAGGNSNSTEGQRSWCIAKQGISEAMLQTSIDFACGVGKVDCTPIQPNGTCFNPDTRYSHASYAMNELYVNSTNPTSACNFQGAAQIVSSDPSYGSCIYPASISATSTNGGSLGFSSTQLLNSLFFLALATILWR